MLNREYRNIKKFSQKQENISKIVREMKNSRLSRLQEL
jgi:hypothetical protein